MNCFDVDETCIFWVEGEKHLPFFAYTTKHNFDSFILIEALSSEPKQLFVLYVMMMMICNTQIYKSYENNFLFIWVNTPASILYLEAVTKVSTK